MKPVALLLLLVAIAAVCLPCNAPAVSPAVGLPPDLSIESRTLAPTPARVEFAMAPRVICENGVCRLAGDCPCPPGACPTGCAAYGCSGCGAAGATSHGPAGGGRWYPGKRVVGFLRAVRCRFGRCR